MARPIFYRRRKKGGNGFAWRGCNRCNGWMKEGFSYRGEKALVIQKINKKEGKAKISNLKSEYWVSLRSTQPRARQISRIIENCYINTYRRKASFQDNSRFGNEASSQKPSFQPPVRPRLYISKICREVISNWVKLPITNYLQLLITTSRLPIPDYPFHL